MSRHDRICLSTETMEEVNTQLRNVYGQMQGCRDRVSSVCSNLTREAGAELEISASLNLFCGAQVGSGTVKDVLADYAKAMRCCAEEMDMLFKAVARANDMFAETETGLVNRFEAAETGAESRFHQTPAFSNGNKFHNMNAFWNAWLKEWEERRKRLEEQRRQELEAANRMQVFDDEGQYGADQGSPVKNKSEYEEYRRIIEENTGRKLTDAELKNYLNKLNSEGCGYSAIVNAIFRAYEGRAEDFRRTFGYDMYRDGEWNFDRLLVDVYSSTDNHNLVDGQDQYNAAEDYDGLLKDGLELFYDDMNDTTGYGTTMRQLHHRAELFLNAHGVDIQVSNDIQVTPENFSELSQNGEIQMLIGKPFYIYNSQGQKIKYSGGHWMTITGVENGRYVVSSWGETYYVDPADPHGWLYYQQFNVQV